MKFLWSSLALALSALADPIQFSSAGLSSAINLVQNGSATDISMQMTAPSTAGWSAIGVGSHMAGALMFVMYPSSNGQGVTVSVRSAPGHVMPTQLTGMEHRVTNSSIDPGTGTMMAQFTCYGCTQWPSGRLDTTATQQPFIYAIGPGSTIQSDDENAMIEQHSDKGVFMGNAASALTTPQQAAQPVPVAPGPGNTMTEESREPNRNLVLAHAAILPLVFFVFMPFAVFVLRLPFTKSIAFTGHWVTQTLSWVLAIVGLGIALDFSVNSSYSDFDTYHQRIGISVIVLTILQPLGGIIHHVQFKKVMSRGIASYAHIVVGWVIIFLGMLNACFGLSLTENPNAAGGLGAAGIVILLAMLGVSLWAARSKSKSSGGDMKKQEMQSISS